jgi:uncharacterized membrane protein YczE
MAAPAGTHLPPLGRMPSLVPDRPLRRLTQLYAGLVLYGLSLATLVRGSLGLDPWDVLHQGIARHLPLSFGTVVILTGAFVLLLWIPLRQRPGIGTVSNVIVIGLAADAGLALLARPDALGLRLALMAGGVALNGFATAAYIGAGLGPGPRDGLMTGWVRRRGGSVRVVRTAIEVAVLVGGWALGGTVGLGTVLYALAIGPLVQAFLPAVTVGSAAAADNGASLHFPARPGARSLSVRAQPDDDTRTSNWPSSAAGPHAGVTTSGAAPPGGASPAPTAATRSTRSTTRTS